MESTEFVIFIGLLVFVSHLFTGVFEKKRIPDVLLLMMIGLLIGPILGLVDAESFGIITDVFTTVTLVFILFQGGLDLRIEAMRSAMKGTMALTFGNFFVTTGVIGLIAWLLVGMPALTAFALGAIVGGTSSAVVIPLVQLLQLQEKSKTILVLESALSDVLCIVFVLAFAEAHVSQELNVMRMVGSILSSFTLAGLIGIASALVWSALLAKVRTLKNSMFTTPAFVFVVYGLSELLGFSGAISALAFGVSLANIDLFPMRYIRKTQKEGLQTFNDAEKQFFSEIVFLLKTFFFVFIGVSIRFSDAWTMLLGVLLTIVIYIIRIPTVKFSVRQPLPTMDLTLMATMVPKGLAAAVLAAVPMQIGMPSGELVRDIVYAVILTSIVLTSVLIPLLEKVPAVRVFYAVLFRRKRTSNVGEHLAGKLAKEARGQQEDLTDVKSIDNTDSEPTTDSSSQGEDDEK